MIQRHVRYLGAVGLVLVMVTAGCGPAAVRANLETPTDGPAGAPECPTLDQPRDTRAIGPEGGRISAGGHTLIVPPGALNRGEQRTFSIVHPVRNFVVVRLEPHGQPFNTPATLQLSYSRCSDADRPLAIYRWTPARGWVKLESKQDRQRMTVEAQLESLSSYALGAE